LTLSERARPNFAFAELHGAARAREQAPDFISAAQFGYIAHLFERPVTLVRPIGTHNESVGAHEVGMRVFPWCVFGFCLGLVLGYAAIYWGWIVYSQHFHVADGDGGRTMNIEWLWAPAGATLMGLLLAFRFALGAAWRATRRMNGSLSRKANVARR
jgi:hypothetical protein